MNLGGGPLTLRGWWDKGAWSFKGHFTCKVHVTMDYQILTWEGKEQKNKRMGIFHLCIFFIIVKGNFPHADCLFSSRKRIPFKHGNSLQPFYLRKSMTWKNWANFEWAVEPSTQLQFIYGAQLPKVQDTINNHLIISRYHQSVFWWMLIFFRFPHKYVLLSSLCCLCWDSLEKQKTYQKRRFLDRIDYLMEVDEL